MLLLLVLWFSVLLEPEVHALLVCVLLFLVLQLPQLPALLYRHFAQGEVTCVFARKSTPPVASQ
jgi:hypothetical protein